MSDSVSLWEIEAAIAEAVRQVEESGDESALAVLNAYLDGRRDKVDQIASYIKSCEIAADNIDAEINRLKTRKQEFENRAKRIKDYAKGVMDVHGKSKLEGDRFTLSVRATPPSVKITDETKIPSKFLDVKTMYQPRKKDIKDAIERGETVPGAELLIGNTTLLVR